MKKILSIVLALAMLLSFAACSNTQGDSSGNNSNVSTGDNSNAASNGADNTALEGSGSTAEVNVDWAQYPTDINEWTAQNYLDYFVEAVEFPSDCETWFQDHTNYWSGFPINECAGCWNDAGTVDFEVFTFNPNGADTTPEEVEEWKTTIRESDQHLYETEDVFLTPMNHMFGDVAISYFYTTDDDVYNAMEDAYQALIAQYDVTPDF
jgi:hypothetical protein